MIGLSNIHSFIESILSNGRHMKMSYLLSVVIPTKNRIQYLLDCVKTISKIGSNNIEIVIQDNSDNQLKVQSLINEFHNENIKYYYSAEKLSQTENSDLALSHATGDYVTYIGDDDTICECILDVVKNMKKYDIDACKYGITVYNWPDLMEKVPGISSYQSPASMGVLKILDPKKELIEVLKNGVQSITRLPRVYHGVVSRRLLQHIYNRIGTYFPGPSPDMANAVACSLFARNMIDIDIPLIISGYGGSSAGGLGKRKLHRGSLKGNFQLRDDVEEYWPTKVPKLWMGCTMWPSSAIMSLKKCKRADLCDIIDYGIIYGETLLQDRGSLKEIIACSPNTNETLHALYHIGSRVANKVFKRSGTVTYCDELKTPIALEDAVNRQNISNKKFDIDGIFESIYL